MAIHDHEFRYEGADGEPIFAYRWSDDTPVRGVLQLAHGMGEHALRYRDKLAPLVESGIVVYANDHRGHGRTAKSKDHFGDLGAGGFPALISDMLALTRIARAENPGKPVILLGHSMGSFALQTYLLDHSMEIDGAVLSGSTALDLFAASGKIGGGLESLNAGYTDPRTPFDWLSRDETEVDKYLADPMCGFSVNEAGMGSMFGTLARTFAPANLKSIRGDLPIYLFSGDEDPVNGHLEWLAPLTERYRGAGVRDVTTDFYEGGRHEMLNETNRTEVMANLRRWLDRVVAQ